MVKDVKEFETKYPLYEAVNRCSRGMCCNNWSLFPSKLSVFAVGV